MPCPTSNAVTSISPWPGRDGRPASSGSHAAAPTQRCGQPRGASIHTVPASAKQNTHGAGVGALHTASGLAPIHAEEQRQRLHGEVRQRRAAMSDSGDGSMLPASASGVTTKLISGIATALAIGLTIDTCANSSIVSGTSPSVTTYCVCAPSLSAFHEPASGAAPVRPTVANRMMATAPNDSQKPGHSTAHGSSSTTSPSAAHSTCDTLAIRPDHSAAATTVSMYRVRCAGMPKPASSTYSSATPAPASAATFCAGSSSGSCAAGEEGAPPQPGRQHGEQAGDHGDVQAGDRNQVADAGAVEHHPVRLVDGALVADHQRDDHAGVLLVRQGAQDAVAQPGAAVLDQVADAEHEAVEAPVALALRPHVAGRAHALLQQPHLVVEAVGIGVAVRALQAHRQLPAFARLHRADRLHRIAKARVPGQRRRAAAPSSSRRPPVRPRN